MSPRLTLFENRRAAGAQLGHELTARDLPEPLLVLALPRGGVPVAHEIARALQAPLDVLTVRKVGMPGQEELAIGAVASGGITVRDRHGMAEAEALGIDFEALAARERLEVERRDRLYRAGRPPADLAGRTVILVDDGMATGSTMLAAVRAARQGGASRVIVAVPVASAEAVGLVDSEADEVIALATPAMFFAVGQWYEEFGQVDDATVQELLGSGNTDC